MNIYPVEGFNFDYYQRINNIKFITDTGDCNKYTIKYIGNIYNQNYVILYDDGQKNETLVTKVILHTIQNFLIQDTTKINLVKRSMRIIMPLHVQFH